MTNVTRDDAPLRQSAHHAAAVQLEASPGTRERRLLPGWRWVAVALAFPIAGYIGIGVDVDDQFTVFGAGGAVLFTLLSGLLLACFAPARTQAA